MIELSNKIDDESQNGSGLGKSCHWAANELSACKTQKF